jgi:hypothetical protein
VRFAQTDFMGPSVVGYDIIAFSQNVFDNRAPDGSGSIIMQLLLVQDVFGNNADKLNNPAFTFSWNMTTDLLFVRNDFLQQTFVLQTANKTTLLATQPPMFFNTAFRSDTLGTLIPHGNRTFMGVLSANLARGQGGVVQFERSF